MPRFISHKEQQTIKIAKNLAKSLKGGETICLIGQLGAGKTVFTKGLAQGLGIRKLIRSPSFVLMKLYPIPKPATSDKRPVTSFCHIDTYRIKNPQEIIDIGALEYLNQPNTITVIEWADKIKKLLPKDKIEVRIEFGEEEGGRKLELKVKSLS